MPKKEVFNKDIVLLKASNVFHNKGYHATSMQDLVDATGLNRSSIYNSFESKMNLYLECLNIYQSKYQNIINGVLIKSKSPLDAIFLIFKTYVKEIVIDTDRKGCLITNCKSEMANQDKAINTFLFTNQTNTIALFEDLVKQGQKAQEINLNQSAKAYAMYLFSSIQGLRMTGILSQNELELMELVHITLQTIK
jgi:TetR/AcrR family transcriptional repressor of nem operon